MGPAKFWLTTVAVLGVAQHGGGAYGQTLMTIPNSSFDCDTGWAPPSWLEVFEISLSSPTTFDVQINDTLLREMHGFHPGKCYVDDGVESLYGLVRVLGQSCQLNNPDIDSCFRKANFPYPVPPNSTVMKIDLWALSNGSLTMNNLYEKFQPSRNPSAAPGHFGLEVCSNTVGCTPSQGYCVPAFTLVAQDPVAGNYKLTAADMWNTTEYTATESIWWAAEEWNQPYATPDYGPYPPCPEDQQGRATTCTGEEGFTISITNLTIDRAEVTDDGSVAFALSYVLEWGDRFAVHPCTMNLFNIRTGGHQYMVPSSAYWSPTLDITSAKKDTRRLAAGNRLGVNLGFGEPVKDQVSDVPWPKQLVLSRTYKVEYFPQVKLDWSQFPFDRQDLHIILSEESLEPGLLDLDVSQMQFSHDKANVGDGWTKESVSYEVVEQGGRQALKLNVHVKRNPRGKVYTLFLPVITMAIFDIAFNALMDFGDTGSVFMTKAVAVSAGIAMCNPDFLGFPSGVSVMPFAQCFVLMIVVAALLSSLMVLCRIFWEFRMRMLTQKIDLLVGKFGAAISTFGVDPAAARKVCTKEQQEAPTDPPSEGEFRQYHDMFVERHILRQHLKRYDLIIRVMMVVWYFVSLLAVPAAYGLL